MSRSAGSVLEGRMPLSPFQNKDVGFKCPGRQEVYYATLTIFYGQQVLRRVEIVSDKKKKQPSSLAFIFIFSSDMPRK